MRILQNKSNTTDTSSIILIGAWPPPSGGVASYTQDLYYNLLNQGLKPKVYAKGQFIPTDKNIKKIFLSFQHPFRTLFSLLQISLEIPSKAIVHTQSLLTARPNIVVFLVFWLLKQIKHIYLIETLHDGSLPERYKNFSFIQKRLYFFIDKILDRFIVPDNYLKTFCIEVGISKNKISVISPLLPLDYLKKNIEEPISTLPIECLQFINKFPFLIITVGAFIPDYDFKTIVEAFLLFSEKYSNSGLIIAETAFIEDKEYKNKILNLIKNTPNILIIQNLPREQLFGLLSKSKIFIRGYINDSFGLSKVEAILMGAKVITTQAGICKFMTLYEYQNPTSLLKSMFNVLVTNESNNNEGNIYYKQLSNQDLGAIINMYNIFSNK